MTTDLYKVVLALVIIAIVAFHIWQLLRPAPQKFQMFGAQALRKKKNPMGLFIQAQGVKDRAALWRHLQAADYATVSVMNDFTLCMDIADAFPDCVVVFRDSNFEPAPERNGFDWFKQWAATLLKTYGDRAKKVVLMVNCEQGHSPARFQMYADIVRHSHQIGVRTCSGNFASGTVKSGMGGDPNDWVQAKPLFEAMRDCPGHYLGIHEYTGFFAWAVSNGESPKGREAFEKAPKVIDWTKAQHHIGRIFGMAQAARHLGLPVPQVIVTEGFLDDMDDIAFTYGNRSTGDVGLEIQTVERWWDWLTSFLFEVWLHLAFWVIRFIGGMPRAEEFRAQYQPRKANGWKSLIPQWAKWYPGVDPGRIYARMVRWVWEFVYSKLGFIIGGHVYCYADAGGQWFKYRVDDAPGYMDEMERWTAEMNTEPAPQVPENPTDPIPDPEVPGPDLPIPVLRSEWRRMMLFFKSMREMRAVGADAMREMAGVYEAMGAEEERMMKFFEGMLDITEEDIGENA